MKRSGATADFVVRMPFTIYQGNHCRSVALSLFQDGYLVLAGGRDEKSDMLSSVEILNKDGGQWQSAVDMPAATAFHCQVNIADSHLSLSCKVIYTGSSRDPV